MNTKNVQKKAKMQLGYLWTFFFLDKNNNIVYKKEKHNLVTTVFLNALASQNSGKNTQHIGQNMYVAVGDSAIVPTAGSIQLGNEIYRKLATDSASIGNNCIIQTFFNLGELVGTFTEYGLFGSGANSVASITANSGILYSIVQDTIIKPNTEGLIIQVETTYIEG